MSHPASDLKNIGYDYVIDSNRIIFTCSNCAIATITTFNCYNCGTSATRNVSDFLENPLCEICENMGLKINFQTFNSNIPFNYIEYFTSDTRNVSDFLENPLCERCKNLGLKVNFQTFQTIHSNTTFKN